MKKYSFIKKSTIFIRSLRLTKEGTHEDLILTKFRNDPVKIVDFLVKAYFYRSLDWGAHLCRLIINSYEPYGKWYTTTLNPI